MVYSLSYNKQIFLWFKLPQANLPHGSSPWGHSHNLLTHYSKRAYERSGVNYFFPSIMGGLHF